MGSLGAEPTKVDWRAILKGHVSATSLTSTISNDSVLKYRSPTHQSRIGFRAHPIAVLAAWGLIVGRQLNSEDEITFDAAFEKPYDSIHHEQGKPLVLTLGLTIQEETTSAQYLAAVKRQASAPQALLAVNGSQTVILRTLIIIHSGSEVSDEEGASDRREYTNGYSLVIDISLSSLEMVTTARFPSNLLQPTHIQTLLERLTHTTNQFMTMDPSSKLSEMEMLTPQDLDLVWQRNLDVPEQIDRCVHDIFEEVTRSEPSAQAVDSWDGSLTYEELERLSNALARRLVSLGIGTGSIVPLCFHKSMWTIVALLGVLKAGAAFLLLDPSLPERRLEYMTQTVKPTLILASQSTHDLSSRLVERVMVVESATFAQELQYCNQQLPKQDASSLMYVIFTSGSTGTPKCALITHANVASAFHHQAEALLFDKKSRILDFSSYAFTTTISNVFGALLLGGCLCVPKEEDRRDSLAEVIRSMEVNIVDLTPSVMQFLEPDEVPNLELIIFGGEAISPREIARWWGKVHTIQLYGQSECTSNAVINENPGSIEEVMRIGKGSGLNTWIVDPEDHNKLQPPGLIGELLLEGPLVGAGYLNQPAEAAAAFVQDPKWLVQGSEEFNHPGRQGRLYKTGDLVQYTDDGSLIFLGRKDTQVKVRGQRVELGEVEHWVKKCTGAKRAVAEVITPQGNNASPTLVAFIEDESAQHVATRVPAEVEAKLIQHLPSYMIPTTFFTMTSIPTTATGKVNRKELRETGSLLSVEHLAQLRTSTGPKRQPVSRLELAIHDIWSRVLGIKPMNIGLDDSFFHLGGDSVAAIKVVSEARKMKIKVEVADIFRHPILHDLVDTSVCDMEQSQETIQPFGLLEKNVDIQSFRQVISSRYGIDAERIVDAYSCTALQEGLVSLSLSRPGACMEHSVLEIAQDVSDEDITTAWAKVVEITPILRSRFVHHSASGLLQLVLEEEMSWETSTNLYEYLKLDRARPMSLGQPFARYCLVRSHDSGQRWFVWTAHHALYDGWSIGLIKDAMRTAFQGGSIDSGPLFQSFIKHVRAQDEEAMSVYWRRMLDSCESLPFPTLPPVIDQPLTNKVVQHNFSMLARQAQDITTTSMIHAAWALITGRVNNSDEAIFGITTSGRNAPVLGIEEMVAPTFATIPLRVKISSNEKASDYLRAIQEHSADVIPFEQAGLQKIANLSPGCKNACMFQSLLVIQRKDTDSDDRTMGTWQTLSQHRWLNTYALMLEIRLKDQDIHISASFDDRIIDTQFVQGALTRLEYTMGQLDTAYGTCSTLSQVQITSPQDLDLIWSWNQHLPESSEQLVHDIIQQRTQDHPDAAAISAWDGELSYKQLDELTSRISNHLSRFDLQPDTLVPLCFEKSMWTAVAALSVLKAGAGFALLEPNLPEERLQTIVEQLDTDLILSSQSNASLSGRLSKRVVQIGPELASTLDETSIVESSQQPSDAMFAVFTSGTTGKPKCVVLSHTNFCSELKYQAKALGFNPKSRVFDFAAYSFDIAVHNIFATFATGGCLCVPAEKDRWGNTSKAMADMKVTLADLTPSVARLIDPLAVPTLETLILAGEAVSLDDVTRWWGRARVVNGYGPAECQISTINDKPSTPEEAIRIGKGMGLLTWVVDQHSHNILLPPGYIGELLLEGPLVSRGYLRNAEETAAKFIQDPIWLSNRGGRMYKTGDLVCYNNDGSLTYVGRKDTQVKIRGQRVELGEVEHYVQGCLAETATILAEIITPNGDNTSPMLVIFVEEPTNDASTARIDPIPPNLDAKLSKRLPRHMKPSAFIHISVLPRTATGKTDRRELQQIGASFSVQDLVGKQGVVSKKQPTSDTERKMQRIWAEVLGVDADTIGVEDNFFQLGGDSIAVLKVVEKAREIGLELAVMDVFHHPSLSIGAKN